MTGEQKTAAAVFLELAADYLSGGYRRGGGGRESGGFAGGAPASVPASRPDGEPGKTARPVTPADVERRTAESGAAERRGGDSVEAVAADVSRCERCELCKTRANTVPGEGAARPLVMVVGEGPGADEDATGRPFVGRAGQLLDRMLDSKGKIALFRTKNCYIANVVKCRPPGNRNPYPDESAACIPFLRRQIALLRPLVILAAGNVSTKALLGTAEGITKLRGIWAAYTQEPFDPFSAERMTIPLLPTFHPSALLRDEGLKAPVWEDLKRLRAKLCELDAGYAAEMANIPV